MKMSSHTMIASLPSGWITRAATKSPSFMSVSGHWLGKSVQCTGRRALWPELAEQKEAA